MAAGIISGIGQKIRDVFADSEKIVRDKLKSFNKLPYLDYPKNKSIQERIKFLVDRYDWESSYEMLLLFRKWFRNQLFYGGYHAVNPIGDIGVGWDTMAMNAPEYVLASNYYRDFIRYSASLYVKTAPQFIAQPTSDDPDAQSCAEAARATLDVMKENIGYDGLRAMEAINLGIYGNSFRYSAYSIDTRYGFVTLPVMEDVEVQLDMGGWMCPQCGMSGEGFADVCPQCGPDAQQKPTVIPPTKADLPVQKGVTKFPRGQEICEVVDPFEVRVRSSCPDLWHAPYLLRKRMVDAVSLAATYPKLDVQKALGPITVGGSETVNSTEDIGLMYAMQIPDLPNDPTQYGAWYERTVAPSKACLVQAWIRPSQYFFDKELSKQFPEGFVAAKVGDELAEARSESIDDHWVHFKKVHVPKRFWGDGDDDLIPEQLRYDELDRLIMRHVDFNTLPVLLTRSQLVDKNNIINDAGIQIEVKGGGGRPLSDAIQWLPGGQLSTDVWNFRTSIFNNMQFHSGVSPSAIGMHQPGVNTYGGQQDMADRSTAMLVLPQIHYKETNEAWAVQMIRIAMNNWLDERVQTTMGNNGQWQYQKLRGEALNLSKLRIIANIVPLDYMQQQSLTQAIAVGAFNPQLPPVVRRKVLELYQLPPDMDEFNTDSKVQWKEIESMKQGGQPQPVLAKDNDQAHIKVLRDWMNSDEYDQQPPQVQTIAYQHLLAHFANMGKMGALMGAVQGMAAEAGGQPQPQQGQQQKQNPNQNAQFRHERGAKGAAAKPNTPQPPGGNQNQTGRPGMSHSAQQRRRNP